MIRKISFSLAVLTVSLLSTGVGNAAPIPLKDQPFSVTIREVNAFRKENGLPPLTVKNQLTSAARKYAAIMAKKDQMGHSVDGTTVPQRLAAEGYTYSRYFENVAFNKGHANPGMQAVKSWKESTSGHREAMLNPEVTEMGVGLARSATGKVYFCLVLGKPR
ncbi:MAG: CAP domain-containing protein [Planctomycetes bacterium]|nr:CAP domain-containing protein [Planctomycetota bacterium]